MIKTWIVTLLILLGIDCVARIYYLSTGMIPQRTKGTVGADLIIGLILLIWGIIAYAT